MANNENIQVNFEALDTNIQQLIEDSIKARDMAYCPYSKFAVGSALLSKTGTVYTGCNVENSSYGAAICAERTAIVKAVSCGETKFAAIAVSAQLPDNRIVAPCGICRQFISEFCKDDFKIYLSLPDKSKIQETSIQGLLPMSFSF